MRYQNEAARLVAAGDMAGADALVRETAAGGATRHDLSYCLGSEAMAKLRAWDRKRRATR